MHTKLRYLLKCSSVVSKTKGTPMICRNMLTISNKSRYALLWEQLWLDSHILCALYNLFMYNVASAFYLGIHFLYAYFFSQKVHLLINIFYV